MFTDKIVKIAVDKKDYKIFLEKIWIHNRYIKDIAYKTAEGLVTEKLKKDLEQNNKLTPVSIETIDLSGIKHIDLLVDKLKTIIDK